MKKYILLFLLPLLLINIKGNAQDSLGISPYSYYVGNDTLPAGSVDSVSFWLLNYGSTAFTDTLSIYTSVQDSGSFLFHPIDTIPFGLISIPPTDSVPITIYYTYDIGPTRFHYDINVIVIWPVAMTISDVDSLFYLQFITLANGVDEIDIHKLINAYPNPTTGNLNINNTTKFGIEEVRIYDARGSLVESLNKPDFICSEKWAPGVYIMKIRLDNNKTHTIRVVKQ